VETETETGWVHWLVVAVFLASAVWFFVGTGSLDSTATEIIETDPATIPIVPAVEITPQPRRKMQSDPPMVTIGMFTRTCNDCHDLFKAPVDFSKHLIQHQDIILDHGLNDRCYNCHDRDDRSKLALRNEETIGYAESPRLCAKCHGPTFRDWEQGMHGRTNGYWNKDLGEQHRLKCVECHDPHAPAYPTFTPMPAPHSLRMGEQHGAGTLHELIDELDPLQHWRTQIKNEHESDSDANTEDHEDADESSHTEEGG